MEVSLRRDQDHDSYHGEEDEWPTNRRYCGGRLSKGWLIVLIAFSVVVGLLVFVLILIFVVGRHVAQGAIDDSKLEISKMTVHEVGHDRMRVNMIASIENYAPLSAEIEEVEMSMYFDENLFATFTMPATKLNAAGSTVLDLKQVLMIQNTTFFTDFTHHMMSNRATNVTLFGKVNMKALQITYSNLIMKKTVIIRGINNFMNPAPQIRKQAVVGATSESIVLEIDTCLNNDGNTEFDDLGTLTLDMVYEGVVVGYAKASGQPGETLRLDMGQNCWTMEGHIVRTDQNADKVEKLVGMVTSPEDLTLTLRGNHKTTEFPLLRDAMAQLESSATFSPLNSISFGAATPKSVSFQTYYETASYGIDPPSLMHYGASAPVASLPYPIQAVFNPTPSMYDYLIQPLGNGKKLGNASIPEDKICASLGMAKTTCVSELDLSATTYIDVKALVFNPMDIPLRIYGSRLDVHFSYSNEWDCHVEAIPMEQPATTSYKKASFLKTCVNASDYCTYNEKGHGSFHMASNWSPATATPLLVVPPFEKKLLYQRLCLSAASVSWMESWLDKQIASNQDAAPYFMQLMTNGTLDVDLGGYRTNLATSQEVPIYGFYYRKEGMYPYKPNDWLNESRSSRGL